MNSLFISSEIVEGETNFWFYLYSHITFLRLLWGHRKIIVLTRPDFMPKLQKKTNFCLSLVSSGVEPG